MQTIDWPAYLQKQPLFRPQLYSAKHITIGHCYYYFQATGLFSIYQVCSRLKTEEQCKQICYWESGNYRCHYDSWKLVQFWTSVLSTLMQVLPFLPYKRTFLYISIILRNNPSPCIKISYNIIKKWFQIANSMEIPHSGHGIE